MIKLRSAVFLVFFALLQLLATNSTGAQGEIICQTPAQIGSDQRLTSDSALSDTSSVVWSGNSYAVAWTDRRSGIYDQIWFMRLNAIGGEVQAATPLTSASAYSLEPSLVWTGSEYGLVFVRDSRIYFMRISSAGAKIGLDIPVSDAGGVAQAPSLVWTGSEYSVAWQDSRDGNDEIYFTRLDIAGAGMGGEIRLTSDSASSHSPRLVQAGPDFAVAWTDTRDGNDEIYFARLDAMGSKLTVDLRITSDTAVSETPDLAWTGSEYGLVWRDRRDGNGQIYFALLTAAGVQIGSDVAVTVSAGNSALPRLQWTGNEYGVTWRDRRDGNKEIYFTHLDTVGLKLSPDLRVTSDAGDSTAPSMIWRGNSFGITWTDDRDGNEEIYFTRISCACGNDDDGDGFTLCDGDCDETDNTVYPGAPDLCDGLNNDCFDPAWPTLSAEEQDNDADSFSSCEGDCLDFNDQVYPGAEQICDGLNNDCDHPGWPGLAGTNDGDNDNDLLSSCAGDCDDTSSCTHPGAASLESATLCMKDCDLDDYGDLNPPAGVVAGTDCDDDGGTTYPGAQDFCDGINNNCSHPGWPAPTAAEDDGDGDGLAECGGDCDDTWSATYPGAPQVCDGFNNDCGHPSWPALTGTDEVEDWDGDGVTGCENDCNVLDPAVNPGAVEVCDGKDNDCDGAIDDLPTCDNSCDLADAVFPEVLLTYRIRYRFYPDRAMVRVDNAFAAAWSDSRDGNSSPEVYFARLDPDGNMVDGSRQITTGGYSSFSPDLAWTGSEFGISWVDTRNTYSHIFFARLDSTGQRIGDEIAVTTGDMNHEAPDMVWTGTDYGLVAAGGFPRKIRFTRLSSTGIPMGPELVMNDSIPIGSQYSIAWTGTNYAVAWVDTRDGTLNGRSEIYLALIDTQGNLVKESRITENPTSSDDPQLVWTGSELGLFWSDDRSGDFQIYFARLDPFGIRLSEDLALTQAPFSFFGVDAVWTGEEYGVATKANGGSGEGGYFFRLDPSGLPLGSPYLIENTDGLSTTQSKAMVAWNGQVYGTLWYSTLELDPGTSTLVYPLRFTQVSCDCFDSDGDGSTNCRDCDDSNTEIYFAAPQVCDGINNDCYHTSWPGLATSNEFDDDMDGITECAGDCNDAHVRVYPGSPEICDGLNNNCNEPGWPSLLGTNENTSCFIDITIAPDGVFTWDSVTPYGGWNIYRGDLLALKYQPSPWYISGKTWTQAPGSNTLAAQSCGVPTAEHADTPPLEPGEIAYYLVNGLTGSVESSLGQWLHPYWNLTEGQRINDNPCP